LQQPAQAWLLFIFMNGGKYDAACTAARFSTQAEGVLLIILGGRHGSGFSVQGDLKIMAMLPRFLRDVADKIEKGNTPVVVKPVDGSEN
jgi:hypothetical protein